MQTKSLRQGKRKGAVMLETALVFISFTALLVGIFDFGHFLFVHQALSERARYAARWGALTDPTDSVAIQNKVLYDQPTPAGQGSNPYMGLNASMVTVSTSGSGT